MGPALSKSAVVGGAGPRSFVHRPLEARSAHLLGLRVRSARSERAAGGSSLVERGPFVQGPCRHRAVSPGTGKGCCLKPLNIGVADE